MIEGEIEVPLPPPTASDLGIVFFKMIAIFGVVILFLIGLYILLKKGFQMRLARGNATSSISVLERRMLSPKTMLYLVQIEHKKVLLAESHLEIKRLESLTEDISEG